MDIEAMRNRESSRSVILGRLKIYGQEGAPAAVILKRGLSAGGPWSEDLEELIREGLVEALNAPGSELSNTSRIRLAIK